MVMNPTPDTAGVPQRMPSLTGQALNGRWLVGNEDIKAVGETGRNFCVCYTVTDRLEPNARYFLKAIDFYRQFQNSTNIVTDLQPHVNSFAFEQYVLEACRGLDRVVTAIDSGQFRFPGEIIPIPFLIFELGEGDLRRHLARNAAASFAWRLRAFHHIATGVRQIHGKRISHNDVKPSNLVVFKGEISKVADLGRAVHRDVPGPFDEALFPGDPAYAPPEVRYKSIPLDFERRRFGADIYMLGAVAIFLFTQVHLGPLVESRLGEEYRPGVWRGSYVDVIDAYRNAYYQALDEDVRQSLPEGTVATELLHILKWLCEPDPMKRGYAKLGKVEPSEHSLDRLIARLDYLAGEAVLEARRKPL
jgi:serine/threonine protein kinase